MSSNKKLVRKHFRDSVFARDHFRCKTCGFDSKRNEGLIDAHHITNRTELPNGGYVKENGITLCHLCHKKAEIFHITGVAYDGFSVEDLYRKIGSDIDLATKKSERLDNSK